MESGSAVSLAELADLRPDLDHVNDPPIAVEQLAEADRPDGRHFLDVAPTIWTATTTNTGPR